MAETLSQGQLSSLVEAIPWEEIVPFSKALYNGFQRESLYKALLLMFLLPFRSERQVAKGLSEDAALRRLCGLVEESGKRKAVEHGVYSDDVFLPSRQTLWHFRHRERYFAETMTDILISMALVAINMGVSLELYEADPLLNELSFVERDRRRLPVGIVELLRANLPVTQDGSYQRKPKPTVQAGLPLFPNAPHLQAVQENLKSPRHQWAEVLGLPAYIEVKQASRRFLLTVPTWIGNNSVRPPPTFASSYNVTCRVLVLRQSPEAVDEVLLSKRLERGLGYGQFTLPGGKMNEGESPEQCVERELEEETGLTLEDRSCAISIRRLSLTARGAIWHVGALAKVGQHVGDIEKLKPPERDAETKRPLYTEWTWYPVSALPSPLFEPTKLIIDDYLSDPGRCLDWRVIDVMTRQVIQQGLFEPSPARDTGA